MGLSTLFEYSFWQETTFWKDWCYYNTSYVVICLAGSNLLHEQLSELQIPTNEIPEAPMINVPVPDQIDISEAAPVVPEQNSESND